MNTKRIIDTARQCAKDKTATLTDFILYAMAKAKRNAENEGEANYLTTKYILKLATPLKNRNKIMCNANGDPYIATRKALRSLTNISTDPYIREKAQTLLDVFERQYLYIFVRQDISPEYQAVQASHATFFAGQKLQQEGVKFDASKTHFVLIGVPDLNALYEARGIASANGIDTYMFHEEDLDNQMTAFTTGIVTQEKRAAFKQFNILKFKGE